MWYLDILLEDSGESLVVCNMFFNSLLLFISIILIGSIFCEYLCENKTYKKELVSIICDLYLTELQDNKESTQHERIKSKYRDLMFIISRNSSNHTNDLSIEKLFVVDVIWKIKPLHTNIFGFDFRFKKYLMKNKFIKSLKELNKYSVWNKNTEKTLSIIHALAPNVKTWIKQVHIIISRC